MADVVLETLESHSSSIASLMSKLPGKRIDTYIEEVAIAGKPEQGELEGGYNPAYVHLAHLPLFRLYSDKADARMQAKWDEYMPEGKKNFSQALKPDMRVRAASVAMSLIDGGPGPGLLTTTKWMARTSGVLETCAAKSICEQIVLARFTRWTIPAAIASDLGHGNVPWFVDMLELHWPDPNSKRAKMAKTSGNIIAVRSGHPGGDKITLKFLNFEPKTMKAQKHWGTKYKVKQLCESLVLIDGKTETQLEMVARIQRMCSPTESQALDKQFDKEWHVPMLRA